MTVTVVAAGPGLQTIQGLTPAVTSAGPASRAELGSDQTAPVLAHHRDQARDSVDPLSVALAPAARCRTGAGANHYHAATARTRDPGPGQPGVPDGRARTRLAGGP